MLIELIDEGERITKEFHPKRLPVAPANYTAWKQKVEAYLGDDALGVTRFRHAQPSLQVPVGMASNTGGSWQKLQGQLAVLIELAKEQQGQKHDDVVTLKPGIWGMNADLKAAWRKMTESWRKKSRSP